MFGKAMLTTVASMNAIAQPSDAIASTVRCVGPRLRMEPLGHRRISLQRLADRTAAQLAHAGEHLPLHDSDLPDGRRDREVGVDARRYRRVDPADRHRPHD